MSNVKMDAQTVGWLIFLALIKNFSASGSEAPFQLEPSELIAKEGSCTEIKCTVKTSFPADANDAYWFWMKDAEWIQDTKKFSATIVYSTNNTNRPVSPEFVDRVKYVGTPFSSWGEKYSPRPLCSILICDLRINDSGEYSFRFMGKQQSHVWVTRKNVTLKVEGNQCLLTFKKPPAVKENDTITLTCSTLSSCPSDPKIEGLPQRDPPLLTNSQQKKNITVSFKASWEDDGKEFSCQTQDNTDKYSIKNISVTVEYAPKNILTKSPENVKKGDSVTLTCSAKGRPPPKFFWFKREGINHLEQSSNANWTINSINESQSGLYYCKARNEHGEIQSNNVNITVEYAPRVAIKMTPSTNQTKREGDQMNLTCEVMSSQPNPDTYTWKKDGTIVDWKKTYVVASIKPEQIGNYTCEATNSVGTGTSKELQIEVQYRPMKPKIDNPNFPDNKVKVNSPVVLHCNTTARPAPDTYSWYRYSKDKNIDSWTSNTTRENSLNLGTVQRADEICYFCNATNPIGTGPNSEESCIEVLYPPTKPTLSMAAEVTEGQAMTITCTTESHPASTLSVTRTNSKPLQFPQHNMYHDPINNFSFTFNVTSAHAGVYSCKAQNQEGSNESKQRTLVVKYSPKDVTVQARPDFLVTENTSLTLHCSAQSFPRVTSVTWMKMTGGKNETIKENANFTIKSASFSDSGLYSCEARNEIGTVKSKPAEVKVKYAPKHTEIFREAEKRERDGRSSVKLSCSSHSYPPVSHYSWYKKINGKGKGTVVGSQQNLTVYSDKPGYYYCIAKNDINQRSSEPVPLFQQDLMKILGLFFLCLVILLIILLILLVNRKRKRKSIQQRATNTHPQSGFLTWWNGSRSGNLMNETILAEPFRSRDDLLPDQPWHSNAQQRHPHPDSTPASNISTVYSTVNLAPRGQAPTAQKPTRQQDGHSPGDSLNYASLQFGESKNILVKAEEETVYSTVPKPRPLKKNEQERLEDYENINTVYVPKSPNPLNDDSDTSEDEADLNYSRVTFSVKPGHQKVDSDSSTSDEDEIHYSEVKI
ncbi:B-cell receptor CD22 [Toxotes jaculatrix]|uniref:B-cell receptor CD22 n=1 Tax=Toxotes jaculatrix TaxID=941984 RepID=UPI001B3B03D0|nr:B-cell receptor CD22 [Toxotes jaculatrix]